MNHTLKQLLSHAPKETREAFASARAELTDSRSLAQYDRDMEDFLMEQQKKERVTTTAPHQSPYTKRMNFLQTH